MNEINESKIGVGVGVLIVKDGKVLLHRRRTSHGTGEFSSPGGHLEHMETIEQCAKRETKEECGIEIDNIKFLFFANVRKYSPKHYAHVGVIATWKSGEVRNLEPDKAELWDWYDLDNLPQPLFEFSRLGIESYKTGKIFFDL